MALPDLTGQYIQDTYQRVLQKSGSGDIVDGTGSLFIPPNATSASYADFAVSASHEIIKEISSSHADRSDFASSGDGIFSGSFSGSYIGDGSSLTGVSAFPFTGDAQITGSLVISGSFASFRVDTDNVILGTGAAANIVNGAEDNVIIGTQAAGLGTITTAADKNVIIGYQAGYDLTSGTNNVLLGHMAGANVANADSNIFIGEAAGFVNSTTNSNICIGQNSGQQSLAAGTIFIGDSAGKGISGATADYSIFIGYQSGYSSHDADWNIGIGYRSLYTLDDGDNNISIGRDAAYSLTDGSYNIVMGHLAGYNITTGTGNIIIGSGSLGDAEMADQLRIGSGNSLTTISGSLATGDIIFPAAVNIGGTQRSLFTSCSLAYSGSNVTQVTQSFDSGTTQITNILYSGSFADGNPLSIAVTGSDGVNKLYTLTYSASLVTEILVT